MTRIILIPKPEENVMRKENYGTISFINIATISWTKLWALFGLDEVIYIFYLDLANGLFWFGRFFTTNTTWEAHMIMNRVCVSHFSTEAFIAE